eukprot:SAG11_NODE_3201_length_2614_cov_2.037376_2_plen_206_part_01
MRADSGLAVGAEPLESGGTALPPGDELRGGWPPPLLKRLLCHAALRDLFRVQGYESVDDLYLLGEEAEEAAALRGAAAAVAKSAQRKQSQALLERLLKAAAAFRRLDADESGDLSGGELARQRSAARLGLAPGFTFGQFWATAKEKPELLEPAVRGPGPKPLLSPPPPSPPPPPPCLALPCPPLPPPSPPPPALFLSLVYFLFFLF